MFVLDGELGVFPSDRLNRRSDRREIIQTGDRCVYRLQRERDTERHERDRKERKERKRGGRERDRYRERAINVRSLRPATATSTERQRNVRDEGKRWRKKEKGTEMKEK